MSINTRFTLLAVSLAAAISSSLAMGADSVNEQVFSVSSPSINVGCEESGNTQVAYAAPEGWEIVEAQAAWTGASNLKSSGTEPVQLQPLHVTASGSIRGFDRYDVAFGLRNCPGGGHATLVLSGRIRRAAK
jgi:hypothetical protein